MCTLRLMKIEKNRGKLNLRLINQNKLSTCTPTFLVFPCKRVPHELRARALMPMNYDFLVWLDPKENTKH